MKKTKRLLCMLLAVVILFGMFPIMASAASTLTITSPVDWEKVDRENTVLKWTKVDGATNYKLTIVNNTDNGALLTTRNMSMGNVTSYNISSYLQKIPVANLPDGVKIWVGAYNSSDTLICSGVVGEPNGNYGGITVSAKPAITCGSASNVTASGAKLSLTVDKNYGSAIEYAGFYVGTSTSVSAAKQYSISSVVNNGTMTKTISDLKANTTYYYWAYAENEIGETISSRKSFTTGKSTGSLTLSTQDVSLPYDSGGTTVTVTASSSWSVSDPVYNVSASAVKDYNYKWLDVSVSGNKLLLMPNRPNWSTSSRSAEVTVTCGSISKTITVTQTKCGQGTPTLTLKRGSTVLSDGVDLGKFTTGQPVMEVTVVSSNVNTLTALLSTYDGTRVDSCSGKVSFDISDLPAGKYRIEVFASNSFTANDYWAQRPYPNGFRIYFELVGPSPTPGNLSASRIAAIDRAFEWYNTVWTTSEKLTMWDGSVAAAGTKIRGIPYSCKNGYVGYAIDDTSISKDFFDLSDNQQHTQNYGADCVQFVWDCLYAGNKEVGARGSFSQIGSYIEWGNIIPGDVFLRDDYPGKSDHVMLIVAVDKKGTSQYTDDVYTIIDCTSDAIGIKYDGVLSAGIRKNSYPYNSVCNGGGSTKGDDWLGAGYRPFRIEGMDASSPSCTHSWSAWTKTSDTQHKRTCSKCGESQTGSHSWGSWSKYSTTQHQHTCSVCSGVVRASHTWDAGVVTTQPTTTASGIKTYTCTACGEKKTETIPPTTCTHTWGSWSSTGSTQHKRTCSKCGETETASHSWGSWTNYSSTQHKHTCSDCGASTYADHDWDAGVVSGSVKTYTCYDCGGTKKETIKPDPAECTHSWGDWTYNNSTNHKRICDLCEHTTYNLHDWDAGVVTKQPTATTTGIRTYTCYDCDGTKTETIPTTACNHSWGSWSSTGSTQHKRTCSKCGETQTASHSWGSWTDYSATQHKHTCSGCGASTYADHDWDSGAVTQEPTETSTGIRTYTCYDCGRTKTEVIPVLGEHKHTFSTQWSSDDTFHWLAPTCGCDNMRANPGTHEDQDDDNCCDICGYYDETGICDDHAWGSWRSTGSMLHERICSKCGETEATFHDWDAGIVTKQPTATSTGIKTYTCWECEGTKEETLPILVDEPIPDENNPTLTITDAKAGAGDEVEVSIEIENNTGIAGLALKLSYPEEFTLTKIEVGTALSTLTYTAPGNYSANPVSLFWDGMDADYSNGTILTLTFRVAEEAPEGEYPISVSYTAGEVFDGNMEDIDLNLVPGIVTVSDVCTGDANGDNVVNGKDITILRRYLAGGYDMSGFVPQGADANKDGVINGKDITLLRRYLAGGFDITLD